MSVPEKPFDSDDSRQTGKDSGDRPAAEDIVLGTWKRKQP